MKKLCLLLLVLVATKTTFFAQESKSLAFSSGFIIESEYREHFMIPLLVHTTLTWEESFKLATLGGYMLSEQVRGPMVMGELSYESSFGIEPYFKIEHVFSDESHTYYGIGLGYGIEFGRYFKPVIFAEIGRERDHTLWGVGLKIPLDIRWYWYNIIKFVQISVRIFYYKNPVEDWIFQISYFISLLSSDRLHLALD